jgi:hypothetical protein
MDHIVVKVTVIPIIGILETDDELSRLSLWPLWEMQAELIRGGPRDDGGERSRLSL